jgi:chromosome segregation ATPase
MGHSPTAHAGAALAALSAKLASARTEESHFADRLTALESELALSTARLDAMESPHSERPLSAHHRVLLNQRIADLLELRAALVAERAKRRRSIDEMAQRKEAIDAALAVLREKAALHLVAAS